MNILIGGLGAVLLVLSGCSTAVGVAPPGQPVPSQAQQWVIAELCHDRVRLLTGLPLNELTEHEVPQLRQLRAQGQDAFFNACVAGYLERSKQR